MIIIEQNNSELVRFTLNKLGMPYIMGTNGKVFTKAMYNDLVKRNPSGWFTKLRLPLIKSKIGKVTTDCHGLIEWFVRECSGKAYDVTADSAFKSAKEKGKISTMPELPGICVRYSGHIGIYIGNGYVVEARGFNFGICVTKLAKRKWTHWYKHPKIDYTKKTLILPVNVSSVKSDKYDIAWLQMALNRQAELKRIKMSAELEIDGIYGKRTAAAVQKFRKYKKWSTSPSAYGIGKATVRALAR